MPIKHENASRLVQFQEIGFVIFIPSNSYGIDDGYYTKRELIGLLRSYKEYPNTIQFLADMME